MATARSRLPLTTITINGVSVGDDLIFGSGMLRVTKEITKNVTIGGVKRVIIDISCEGEFQVDGNACSTLNTDSENPGSTPGNQDLIVCNSITIAGVVKATYEKRTNITSCTFRGIPPALANLGENAVVDATDGGVAYEA